MILLFVALKASGAREVLSRVYFTNVFGRIFNAGHLFRLFATGTYLELKVSYHMLFLPYAHSLTTSKW